MAKSQRRPKKIQSQGAKALVEDFLVSSFGEASIINCEPILKVSLIHSLAIEDVFDVAMVRQKLTVDVN